MGDSHGGISDSKNIIEKRFSCRCLMPLLDMPLTKSVADRWIFCWWPGWAVGSPHHSASKTVRNHCVLASIKQRSTPTPAFVTIFRQLRDSLLLSAFWNVLRFFKQIWNSTLQDVPVTSPTMGLVKCIALPHMISAEPCNFGTQGLWAKYPNINWPSLTKHRLHSLPLLTVIRNQLLFSTSLWVTSTIVEQLRCSLLTSQHYASPSLHDCKEPFTLIYLIKHYSIWWLNIKHDSEP